MISFTRTDQDRDKVTWLNAHFVERANHHGSRVAGFSARQVLASASPPQFERPGDSIAALRMGAGYLAFDVQRCGHGAAPPDGDVPSWRRMNCHAARLHIARYTNMLVRGIRKQHGRLRCAPSLNEVVGAGLLDLLGEQVELEIRLRTDTQVSEPGLEILRINADAAGDIDSD